MKRSTDVAVSSMRTQDDDLLRVMDRMGSGAAARARDEALIAKASALGKDDVSGDDDEESHDDDEGDEGRSRALVVSGVDARAQGSRALQILKINPQVKNVASERTYLSAIHKSLAPKIRTEMKMSSFTPKLPAWAQPKRDEIEITGDLMSVEAALEANHKFQEDIRAALEALDEKIAQGTAMISEVTKSKNRKGRRRHWSSQQTFFDVWGLTSDLYFRIPTAWAQNNKHRIPEEERESSGIVSQVKLHKQITPNADQLRLGWANLVEKIPLTYTNHSHLWTKKDDAALSKGVHFQLQQARLLTDQRMSLEELAGVSLQPLDTLLAQGNMDVILRDAEAIDWAEVVRMHVPGRTVDDCRIRWMNTCDPRIAKSDWNEQEDELLCTLFEAQKGNRDWFAISDALYQSGHTPDGVRTPHQCVVRYQMEFNPSLVKRYFTAEEDQKILAWVREHGPGQWSRIARTIPGHTGQQVLHRWRKIGAKKRRTGSWTEEEDEALRVAVSVFTNGQRIKWTLIADQIPTRTDVQCRERWMHCLDPNIVTGPWTVEEDQALLSAVAPDASSELKFNEWGKLAQLTPGRTPKSAMRRLKALLLQREREAAGLPPKRMPAARKKAHKRKKDVWQISRKTNVDVLPLTMRTRRSAEKNTSQEVTDLTRTERPQRNKRQRIAAPTTDD